MKEAVESVCSALLTLAAIVIAGTVVWHLLLASDPSPRLPLPETVFVEDWEELVGVGITRGPDNAPVHIIEFSDLECPFCARYWLEALKPVLEQYGSAIATTFIHFPLQRHRFAVPAATAAECAHEQQHFGSFVSAVFAGQDSTGLKSWQTYASEAGIEDDARFEDCMQQPHPRVTEGRRVGEEWGVFATPTVVVSGWKLGTPPDFQELSRIVERLLDGAEPF